MLRRVAQMSDFCDSRMVSHTFHVDRPNGGNFVNCGARTCQAPEAVWWHSRLSNNPHAQASLRHDEQLTRTFQK